mmetsp:Transcript_22663/g.52317  ORF Transcript_22663/g.52317 Transcript_22663/m.52317 type:complete len:202 (-) Transcript_22663:51-656(-)
MERTSWTKSLDMREMCTNPSATAPKFTKAPYAVMVRTVPVIVWPSWKSLRGRAFLLNLFGLARGGGVAATSSASSLPDSNSSTISPIPKSTVAGASVSPWASGASASSWASAKRRVLAALVQTGRLHPCACNPVQPRAQVEVETLTRVQAGHEQPFERPDLYVCDDDTKTRFNIYPTEGANASAFPKKKKVATTIRVAAKA